MSVPVVGAVIADVLSKCDLGPAPRSLITPPLDIAAVYIPDSLESIPEAVDTIVIPDEGDMSPPRKTPKISDVPFLWRDYMQPILEKNSVCHSGDAHTGTTS